MSLNQIYEVMRTKYGKCDPIGKNCKFKKIKQDWTAFLKNHKTI